MPRVLKYACGQVCVERGYHPGQRVSGPVFWSIRGGAAVCGHLNHAVDGDSLVVPFEQ